MKLFLFKLWKQLPFQLKLFISRLVRPKYMVAVAAIIIDNEGKILLGKHTYRKYHPWGILAGNLEYGEAPENAIIREVKEETGLVIEVQSLLKAVSAKEDHHISLIYQCNITDGEFRPSAEIEKIKCFSSKELPFMLKTEKTLLEGLMKRE
ncbi:MAG: NUDIX hydrolase [Chloroflexi bacterium]|nr:NUDIX hydrolase [Chloroflexota bacterium]